MSAMSLQSSGISQVLGTPQGVTRSLRTEERASSRHLMASPRIREVMGSSVEAPVATQRDGRRHFESRESLVAPSSPRAESRRRQFGSPIHENPVLLGTLPTEAEQKPSRRMAWGSQQEREEPKIDAPWKRVGIFDSARGKLQTPRDAPHRSSSQFIASQQVPSLRELSKLSPKQQCRELETYFGHELTTKFSPRQQSREFQGLEAKRYFSNEPQSPTGLGVKRDHNSRNIAETEYVSLPPPTDEAPAHAQVLKPWAVDGPSEHLQVASRNRIAVQTSKKNESSGPLQDGLMRGSLSQGRMASLSSLGSRGRNNLTALSAMEAHVPCWTTNPLPRKNAVKPITDGLPAYNAEESVQQLIHHYTNVATTQKDMPLESQVAGSLTLAPYAMVDAPPIEHKIRTTLDPNSPCLDVDGIPVSSLMSSGHSEAVSSKIYEQLEDQKLPARNPKLCDDDRPKIGIGMKRSQSALPNRLGGGPPSLTRSNSAQARQICLGRNGNNHASSAWSCGLCGKINDKPWVNMEKQGRNISQDNRKALSARADPPARQTQPARRVPIRDTPSSEHIELLADSALKRCESRIQTLADEMDAMNVRSEYISKRINAYKRDASQPALEDLSFASHASTTDSYHALLDKYASSYKSQSLGPLDYSSLGVRAG